MEGVLDLLSVLVEVLRKVCFPALDLQNRVFSWRKCRSRCRKIGIGLADRLSGICLGLVRVTLEDGVLTLSGRSSIRASELSGIA